MASVVSMRSQAQSQPLHNFPLSEPKWVTTSHHFRRHFESTHNHNHNSSFGFATTPVSRGLESLDDTVSPALHLSSSLSAENENENKKSMVLDVETISTASSDGKPKIILRFHRKNKSDDSTPNPSAVVDVAQDSAPNFLMLRSRKVIISSQSSLQNVVQESSSKASEEKKIKRRKFSIALTKQAIEDDIFAMTGQKPSRRPNKRPKKVQKELDTLYPGLWLPSSITANRYRVRETPEN